MAQDISEALSKYLSNLDIGDKNRSILRDAREDIRRHLRQDFSAAASGKIKFMTQGSFQYQTINRPCHPPQQMDLDDGMYIANSLIGNTLPSTLLDAVAKSLHSLAVAKNSTWKVVTDKPSCVRVVIANDKHVDIPVYSAPDKEMGEIRSSATSLNNLEHKLLGIKYIYEPIKSDLICLAHGKNGWVKSDPRYIYDWFMGNVRKYGRQYILVCRILKGWRDHQWPLNDSPLTSILLMRMVEKIFEEIDTTLDDEGRLDEVLYDVAKQLASTINKDIDDPDPTRNDVLNEFSNSDRQLCIERFDHLKGTLHNVLHGQSESDFIEKLYAEFGPFFPKNLSLCKLLPAVAFATPSAAKSHNPGIYGG